MTIAPPQESTEPATGGAARPQAPGEYAAAASSVTAVLVVHDGAAWLTECLDGIAGQHRLPDRLLVVDTGSTDGSDRLVAEHPGIWRRVPEVRRLTLGRDTGFPQAVAAAVDALPGGRPGDWIWLLQDDSAAYPQTLERLLDASQRSPSVGVLGPKLVLWEDPARLLCVGIQATRTGRRILDPLVGEPDQGQHDDRQDVLAVPASGMLVRRSLFESLGGFDPGLGPGGQEVDLCWRAHRAGHRTVVVPGARVRDASAGRCGHRAGGPTAGAAERRSRRSHRRAALAHCAWPMAPLLWGWIAVTSVLTAALLLMLKRPRQAVLELADIGALLAPWRPAAARWRAWRRRRTRREDVVRRRDLTGLFAPGRLALRHRLDGVQAAVELPRGADPALGPAAVGARLAAIESGPVARESEQLEVMPSSLSGRVLRHPGLLAVVVALAASLVTWRGLLAGGGFASGTAEIAGGELLPVTADAGQLWHAAVDAWAGPGLGRDSAGPDSGAPHLLVLAGLALLLQQLPLVGSTGSPAGLAIAWLLLLAMPLSAWTAYLAGRAATRARWLRAAAAVGWAGLATLSTAQAQGRLGPVVAHVLLPLVAAGFACSARRGPRFAGTFATALAVAVTGAFVPGVLAVCTLAALVLLLLGPGLARVRALVLLTVPTGLLGPWVLDVAADPRLLLGGAGIGVWSPTGAEPWHLALLHPGGPGSYAVLVTAPVILAGLAALARRRPVSGAMTALAVLAVVGLALGLAARHVVLGRTDAGDPVTVWPGTALDLTALALLAAALVGAAGLRERLPRRHRTWALMGWSPLVAAAVAAAVAGVSLTAWRGVDRLEPAPRQGVPAVARDQATSPLGNRLLVLTEGGGTVGYRLHGAEPGPVSRPLPGPAAGADPLLAAAVRTLLSDATVADTASGRLSDLAIGFVGLRGPADDTLIRRLDSTAGLAPLSKVGGVVLWRVLPRQAAATDAGSGPPAMALAPARARLEGPRAAPLLGLAVDGPHGRLDQSLAAGPAPRRLVVAEPLGWAEVARVTFDGRQLRPVPGAAQPTYDVPAKAGRLVVEIPADHPAWRLGQLGLLAVVVFLAVPFGRAPRRRRS